MQTCFPWGICTRGYDGNGNILLDNIKYRDRDFLLIDESHNFGTQARSVTRWCKRTWTRILAGAVAY